MRQVFLYIPIPEFRGKPDVGPTPKHQIGITAMKFGKPRFQIRALIDLGSALDARHGDVLDKDMRRLRYYASDSLRICSRIYNGNGTAVAVAYENRFVDGALFEDFGQAEQGFVMEIVGLSVLR